MGEFFAQKWDKTGKLNGKKKRNLRKTVIKNDNKVEQWGSSDKFVTYKP